MEYFFFLRLLLLFRLTCICISPSIRALGYVPLDGPLPRVRDGCVGGRIVMSNRGEGGLARGRQFVCHDCLPALPK
ncbi:hypothetical protein B0T25DRAFT_208524 [Lasiosphaeria hispida]|uniref:Secreted protein n=1 Tax=Lasiosphaeria hispida TaxID=260671 RepID=A0AAJ0HIH2_9PEZI|nr:hypothetical protein B0T25DRAFT_208524 [Lasiosphaeria hispida]